MRISVPHVQACYLDTKSLNVPIKLAVDVISQPRVVNSVFR